MPKLILFMTCSLSLWADLEDKPSSVLEGISSPYQLELADFNNDGKTDLAVSSWARLPVKGEQYDFDKHRVLLFFQKEGRFSLPADRQIKMRQPWGMRAGDFDEDGKTDLAVKESAKVMHLLLGSEGLAVDHASKNINDSDRYVGAGRLSRGGKMDFLCGPVWRKWYGGDRFLSGYCYGPEINDNRFSQIADLNKDGDNDMIFLSPKGIRLYYGPFNTQKILPDDLASLVRIETPMPASGVRAADMNGDGRLDLVAAVRDRESGARSVAIYFQQAPVGFRANAKPSLTLKGITGGLDTADLNRDGLTDLVVSDSSLKRIHVFIQRKGRPLGGQQVLKTANYDVAVGDVNGDKYPDLAVSDGRSRIRFFLNDGKESPARVAPEESEEPPESDDARPAKPAPPEISRPKGARQQKPALKFDIPPPEPGPDYEDPDRMPFYTGSILPTPQKVTYRDDYYSLVDTGLFLGKGIDETSVPIQEIQKRVERYGGKLRRVASAKEKCDTLILLGETHQANVLLKGRKVPAREQGYLIHCLISEGRNIAVLQGHDSLGLLWAAASFNQLVHVQEGKPVVRAVEVFDFPEYPNRGFIAGSWPEAGHYCIAFKINKPVFQGALHDRSIRDRGKRAQAWRQPLAEGVKKELETYGKTMTPAGIQWYVGGNPIAAEKKIRSANEEDFTVVLGWAEAAAEAGGNFCLKYDDHRFPASPEDLKAFGSAKEADVHLLTRLHRELVKQHPKTRILFCPPFYWGPDSPAMYSEPRDEYLFALGKRLPGDIEIFWTGPRVKSSKVTPGMVNWITERIQRKPVYWQNAFGAPHMFTYHYVTDPIRSLQEWFYDGFFKSIDTYMFNTSMPAYAAASAACSDYCWNPKAYDAERSIREAASKLVGPETNAALIELNRALSYFDPFGLRRTPGAARKLPEMKQKLATVNAVWQEVERRNIKAVMKWTNMNRHVQQVNRFTKQLERSPDLAAYRRDAIESQRRAEKEVGFNEDKDIFLSAYDFIGGAGPSKYANRCEKRLATWIYGRRTANPSMEAAFRVEPFPPEGDYLLVVSAQDDDADSKCRIRITVNGTKIFEGENSFIRFGWSRHTFRIPATALKRKTLLRIENAVDTGRSGGPPFFMLNYAVVRKAKD